MPHTPPRHPDAPQHAGTDATPPTPGPAVSWPDVLDALRCAGARAGATAADWWAQDTVGGRTSGDTAATARLILAGIDDGDPLILDALPGLEVCGRDADAPTEAEVYTQAAPHGAPDWDSLDEPARAEAIDAFGDGHQRGVEARVVEHCRTALPDPSGTDRIDGHRPAA